MITIRRAVYDDIPLIMQFVDEHWKKDHILARDRAFFEWQFVDGEKVNVIIAVDDVTQYIYGINGYVMYNHFTNPDITGCMWKALSCKEYPMLGLSFGDVMYETTHARYCLGIGSNSRSRKYEELNGAYVVKLKHAYKLGQLSDFQIANIEDKKNESYITSDSKLELIETIEQFKSSISIDELGVQIPYKDYEYIEHRYFKHPIYKYDLYSLKIDNESCHAVFVFREINVFDRKCAKIVDYFGEDKWVAYSGAAIEQLIHENDYEFISFYNYGIRIDYLKDAGFSFVKKDDCNVIPCYFEPFTQKNIDVYAVMIPEIKDKVRLVLGDGDQDRPS